MSRSNLKTKIQGIYIHIPFCVKKCGYCDFAMHAQGKTQTNHSTELQKRYLSSLEKELISYTNEFNFEELKTVYIGGGTPSLLTEDNIKFLGSFLQNNLQNFGNDLEELTIECEPGTVSKSKVETILETLNPHRVSLGGQSLHQQSLELMGRGHNLDQFYEAVNLFSEYKQESAGVNFESINTDMIMGLPYESLDQVMYTAEKMIELEIDHISTYLLEVEPNTNFGKKYQEFEGPLPSEEELEQIFTSTHEFLMGNGFDRYSLASFAKDSGTKDYSSVHNWNYWKNETNFLGIGVGAYSKLNSQRFGNSKKLNEYFQIFENSEFQETQKQKIQSLYAQNYDLVDDLNDLIYGMIISKHGLSSKMFENFLNSKFQNGSLTEGKALKINNSTFNMANNNLKQVSEYIMNEIIHVLEKKCDSDFVKISKNEDNLQVELTTKGLFRADAITALISELFD